MGWSDKEFWEATPRKYFAVLHKIGEIKQQLSTEPQKEVLVGKKAFLALSSLASKMK